MTIKIECRCGAVISGKDEGTAKSNLKTHKNISKLHKFYLEVEKKIEKRTIERLGVEK